MRKDAITVAVETPKNLGGRPPKPGGPDPKRWVRMGDTWDRAAQLEALYAAHMGAEPSIRGYVEESLQIQNASMETLLTSLGVSVPPLPPTGR